MKNEYISLLTKNVKLNITICQLLTSLYTINKSKAFQICHILGFNPNKRLKTNNEFDFFLQVLSSFIQLIEKKFNIKSEKFVIFERINYFSNLKNTKNLKYYRLKNGLPVHGQRTHSNAQIAKLKLHFNE